MDTQRLNATTRNSIINRYEEAERDLNAYQLALKEYDETGVWDGPKLAQNTRVPNRDRDRKEYQAYVEGRDDERINPEYLRDIARRYIDDGQRVMARYEYAYPLAKAGKEHLSYSHVSQGPSTGYVRNDFPTSKTYLVRVPKAEVVEGFPSQEYQIFETRTPIASYEVPNQFNSPNVYEAQDAAIALFEQAAQKYVSSNLPVSSTRSRTVRRPDYTGAPENRVVRDSGAGRILRGSRDSSKRGFVVGKRDVRDSESVGTGGKRFGGSRRGRFGESADIEEGIQEFDEQISGSIWQDYSIVLNSDGVYYAENISPEHVRALRNGRLYPPSLPFFAPRGGGNNQTTGEGYYFSVDGRRYNGKYGASGALVRRRRLRDGKFVYLLAKRSEWMSSGGGKWSFPGGVHKDLKSSETPGLTAIEEFREEVGGKIGSVEPIYVFNDQRAPDWRYDTYVYDVRGRDLGKLRLSDGENTDIGWFTAKQIMEMSEKGELLESFSKQAREIITNSGDSSIPAAPKTRSLASTRSQTIKRFNEKEFDLFQAKKSRLNDEKKVKREKENRLKNFEFAKVLEILSSIPVDEKNQYEEFKSLREMIYLLEQVRNPFTGMGRYDYFHTPEDPAAKLAQEVKDFLFLIRKYRESQTDENRKYFDFVEIEIEKEIKRRQQESRIPKGGNERPLMQDFMTPQEFEDSNFVAAWLYPDGSLYPVNQEHRQEHDKEQAFRDGLVRLRISRPFMRKTRQDEGEEASFVLADQGLTIQTLDMELSPKQLDALVDLYRMAGLNQLAYEMGGTEMEETKNSAILNLGRTSPSLDDMTAKDEQTLNELREILVSSMGPIKQAGSENLSTRSSRVVRSTRSQLDLDRERNWRQEELTRQGKLLNEAINKQFEEKWGPLFDILDMNLELSEYEIEQTDRRKKNALSQAGLDKLNSNLLYSRGNQKDNPLNYDSVELEQIINAIDKFVVNGKKKEFVLNQVRETLKLRKLYENAVRSTYPEVAPGSLVPDIRQGMRELSADSELRRGMNERPMRRDFVSTQEFVKTPYRGAWIYPDGKIYPVIWHSDEHDYEDSFEDGSLRVDVARVTRPGEGMHLTLEYKKKLTDNQIKQIVDLYEGLGQPRLFWEANSIFTYFDEDSELKKENQSKRKQILRDSLNKDFEGTLASRGLVEIDSSSGIQSSSNRSATRSTSEPLDINSQIDANNKELKELDNRLDNEEIDLDEYRRLQIPLRKRAAELGKSQKGQGTERPNTSSGASPKRERVLERGDGMIKRDESGRPNTWDSAAFLEQQRQNRIERLRGMGFSENEISSLMGAPSQAPNSTRSRVSSRSIATEPQKAGRFNLEASSIFAQTYSPTPTTKPNQILVTFSDGELLDALEIHNLRSNESGPQGQGRVRHIPKWFPTPSEVTLELNNRGYDVKTIRMNGAASPGRNDPIYAAFPLPNASTEQRALRLTTTSAALPNFIEEQTVATGEKLLTQSGREMKDWKLLQKLQSLDNDGLDDFNKNLMTELSEMRRRKEMLEINSEEYDTWLNQHTALRLTVEAEKQRRQIANLVASKQPLTIDDDPFLSVAEYAFLRKAEPNLSTRSSFGAIVDQMFEDGRIDDSIFETLANYHDAKESHRDNLINSISEALDTDILTDENIELNPEQSEMIAEIVNTESAILAKKLSRLGLNELTKNEIITLGVDVSDVYNLRNTSLSTRSRRGKNRKKWNVTGDKKVTGNMKKLTPEQVRIEQDQKRRSQKVPKKRKEGPSSKEWLHSTRSSIAVGETPDEKYLSGLSALRTGDGVRVIGRPLSSSRDLAGSKYLSFGSDINSGDILPHNFLSSPEFQGQPRYSVSSTKRSKNDSSRLLLRDLQTGGMVHSVIADDHQIIDVARPASTRSGRAKVPQVWKQTLEDFRTNNTGLIAMRVEGLIKEVENLKSELDSLDEQFNDNNQEWPSPEMENRSALLEQMMQSSESEVAEIYAAVQHLVSEQRQASLSAAASKRAIEVFEESIKYNDYASSNLTLEELAEVESLLLYDPDMETLLFDTGHQGFSVSAPKNNEDARAFRLARQLNEMADYSVINIPDTDYVLDEMEDDEEDARFIRQSASSIVDFAVSSVLRKRKLQDAKNAVINVAYTETSDIPRVLSLGKTTGNRSSSAITSRALIPAGIGLRNSEQFYPGRAGKFLNSNVSFVAYDGNRNELLVTRSGAGTFRYGGMSDDSIDNFLKSRKPVEASINELNKDANYVVSPDGRHRGLVAGLSQLLERDAKRLKLTESENSLLKSLAKSYSASSQDDVELIDPVKAHTIASKLFENKEFAAAINIVDAIEDSEKARIAINGIAPLYSRFSKMPDSDIGITITNDEAGVIRDEISDLARRYSNNKDVVSALDIYDKIIFNAQNGALKTSFKVSPEEYEQISAGVNLLRSSNMFNGMISFAPLDHAMSSQKLKFDSTQLPKNDGLGVDKLFNAGAPYSLDLVAREDLMLWAESSKMKLAQSLAGEKFKTTNTWNALSALKAFSSPTRSTSSKPEVARKKTNVDSSFAKMKPSDYSNMAPLDKLVWINKNMESDKNGKGVNRPEALSQANDVMQVLGVIENNINQRDNYENTIYGKLSQAGPLPEFAKSWDFLSPNTHSILDSESRRLFSNDFRGLNHSQAADILRRLRPEASKKGTDGYGIPENDLSLIWDDVMLSSQKLLDAIDKRRSLNIQDEVDDAPLTPTPRAKNTDSIPRTQGGIRLSQAVGDEKLEKTPQPNRGPQNPDSELPQNPAAAKIRRQQTAETISNAFSEYKKELDSLYSQRYQDNQHSAIWTQLGELFTDADGAGRNFGLGHLDDAIDVLDDYLTSDFVLDAIDGKAAGFAPRTSKIAQKYVQDSILRAKGVRNYLNKLRNEQMKDSFIDKSPGRGASFVRSVPMVSKAPDARAKTTKITGRAIESYFSARRGELLNSTRSTRSASKSGRAEIRAERTRFNELLNSLDVEISKADDPRHAAALKVLKITLTRQKSGKLSDRRTNAGALYLTQDEIDDIIEALYVALDRQVERGSEARIALFGEMAELMAKAAMATFINKTTEPISSRTIIKINERGEEVEIALNE
jgi:8-oxo-dGTP pyrophosphatase MutT (NUDIX family)